MYVVLEQHLCEVQLHLSSFYGFKDDQHKVYEWSRTLAVTVEMEPKHLFQNTGPEILGEMIRLAQDDWCSTRLALPQLLGVAGRFKEAREIHLRVRPL